MKALTLHQPWATLMATKAPDGFPWKSIETRSWYTRYRGEMVIHSSKTTPWEELGVSTLEPFRTALKGVHGKDLPASRGLCVVRVLDCIPTSKMYEAEFILGRKPPARELQFGNFLPGRFAWLTEFVRALDDEGVVRGNRLLWNWTDGGIR